MSVFYCAFVCVENLPKPCKSLCVPMAVMIQLHYYLMNSWCLSATRNKYNEKKKNLVNVSFFLWLAIHRAKLKIIYIWTINMRNRTSLTFCSLLGKCWNQSVKSYLLSAHDWQHSHGQCQLVELEIKLLLLLVVFFFWSLIFFSFLTANLLAGGGSLGLGQWHTQQQ